MKLSTCSQSSTVMRPMRVLKETFSLCFQPTFPSNLEKVRSSIFLLISTWAQWRRSFFPCFYMEITGGFLFLMFVIAPWNTMTASTTRLLHPFNNCLTGRWKPFSKQLVFNASSHQSGTKYKGSECRCLINPVAQEVAEWEWCFA